MKVKRYNEQLSQKATGYILKYFREQDLREKDIGRVLGVHASVVSKMDGKKGRRITLKHVEHAAMILKISLPLFLLSVLPEPSPHDSVPEEYTKLREFFHKSDAFRRYLDGLKQEALPDKRRTKNKP